VSETAGPDFAAITERQQQVWSAGDFNVIAIATMWAAEMLVQAVDPRAGDRVLDVACGSGNVAPIAARRYCDVTGIDYVPALLERARLRASAEGTAVDFQEGAAQALPFPDGSFDTVLSVFGAAAWMPEGYGRDLFGAQASFVPPPPGMRAAVRWRTEDGLRELFGSGISGLTTERRTMIQYYRSVDHAVEVFRTYFGPLVTALQAVGPSRAPELEAAIREVLTRYDQGGPDGSALQCDYQQAIATRG
jgi:SAM-dependent methyltransferase